MVQSGPWAVARTTLAVVSLLVVMMSAGNAWVVVNSYAVNAAIAASFVAGSSELMRTYKARLQLRRLNQSSSGWHLVPVSSYASGMQTC